MLNWMGFAFVDTKYGENWTKCWYFFSDFTACHINIKRKWYWKFVWIEVKHQTNWAIRTSKNGDEKEIKSLSLFYKCASTSNVCDCTSFVGVTFKCQAHTYKHSLHSIFYWLLLYDFEIRDQLDKTSKLNLRVFVLVTVKVPFLFDFYFNLQRIFMMNRLTLLLCLISFTFFSAVCSFGNYSINTI